MEYFCGSCLRALRLSDSSSGARFHVDRTCSAKETHDDDLVDSLS